jgi:pimeloyl-ACP methyl ester carboxylesterase
MIYCLVIAGLNDLFTPPYLARSVAEGLSEVELEIWEGMGHFPFVEDPLRFNRRLEMFIRRCLNQGNSE